MNPTDSEKLTVSLLKEKTGITDQQLNQKVEQSLLKKLASFFDSWEKYVESPGLNLKVGQIADIRECASRHGNEMAMYKVLKLWQNRNPYVTYGTLVEVLVELNEGTLADQICKTVKTQLSEHGNEDSPPILVVPPTPQPNMPDCSTIAENIERFERRFGDLRVSALQEVTDSCVSITEFRQRLMTLPSTITNEHEQFLLQKYPLFEKAESIEGIFLHLNFYLSFIDFSLLEHIIEHFGSESLKQRMKQYSEDMRQFRMTTTISEVIPHLPQKSHSPQGYSKLEVKANIDCKTSTLEDLDQYRKRFASEFSLSKFALFLSNIKKSSLIVTWLVPSALVQSLGNRISKELSIFAAMNILKITLDEDHYYKQIESRLDSQPAMPRSEEVLQDQPALQTLECDICNEKYGEDSDNVPRILRCGHTHCTKCLRSMMTTRGVKCPYCLKEHPLNPPDITQLTPNALILEILRTKLENQKPITLGPLCEVNCNNPATVVCADCEPGSLFKFCDACDRREHERDFGPVKRHRRYPIGQVPPSLKNSTPCYRHPQKQALYYSEQLQEFACDKCETLSDWSVRVRQFQPIDDCARRMRGYLQRLNQRGRDIIANLTESKIKIGDTLHNLDQSAPAAKTSISNTFSKVISDIQARQQQLLNHVDVECEDRKRCLEQQLAQIHVLSENFKSAYGEVIGLLASVPDSSFFTSYPDIKTRMEELVLTEDRSLLVPLCSHEIPVYVSQEICSKLPTLGSVCGGRAPSELQAEPNANKCDLLSLSWEMAGNISETQGFDVSFEQVIRDLGAVLGDVSDNHKYLQREPQYQRVTGKELRTYVDFLCPGYTYRFKVHSINAAGPGMWSDSVTALCKDFPINIEYTKRIHRICIPQNGHYKITARGAKATDGLRFSGGKGAIISATFSLKQGEVLIILCGGMSQRHEYSSGGGGGTFVALNEANRENLLIVAGGGGGTRGCDEGDFDGANASLGPNGTDGLGREHGKGGIDGGPGEDANLPDFRGPCWGYGGAGALVDSNSGMSMSFVNGGNGGRNGGFGGGGAVGLWGGGGGGGFSGGGGGRGGGGGGSYVRSDATFVEKKVGNEGAGSIQIDRAELPYPPESNFHSGPVAMAAETGAVPKTGAVFLEVKSFSSTASSIDSRSTVSSMDSGYTTQSSSQLSSRHSSDDTHNVFRSASYYGPASAGFVYSGSIPEDPIKEHEIPRKMDMFEAGDLYITHSSSSSSKASSGEIVTNAPGYTSPGSTGQLTNTQVPVDPGPLDPSIQHSGEYRTVQEPVATYPIQHQPAVPPQQQPIHQTDSVVPPSAAAGFHMVKSEYSMPTSYPPASAIFNNPPSGSQQAMHHPPAEAPYQGPTDMMPERPHP